MRQRRGVLIGGVTGGVIVLLIVAIIVVATHHAVSAPNATTLTPDPVTLPANWLEFDYDGQHSGVNPVESQLSRQNVSKLKLLWSAHLPEKADSTPVLVGSVAFPDGRRGAVLYMTTTAGRLVALDANTGALLWQAATNGLHLTNSSPTIDPSLAYVYSYGLDAHVHKYAAATGTEITGNGWPLLVTLMPDVEKESSALTIANGRLYVTTSGYIGDGGHYAGHVVSLPLAGGTPTVWNSLCSDKAELLGPTQGQQNYCNDIQSGIWARAGVIADPITGAVYVVTGNGPLNAQPGIGGTDWGDSVIALSADLTQIVDSYTPTNADALNAGDLDLGSTAPALLPRIANSTTPLLALQGGKDGVLRMLNRQNLSSQGGIGHLGGEVATASVPGPGGHCLIYSQPAVWTDATGQVWVLFTDNCGMAGYQVQTDSSGHTTLHMQWQLGQNATSPVVANGVLFVATSGQLLALNPPTGATLWSSTDHAAGGTIGDIHWESPIVIDGRLYITDEDGNAYCYALPA